MNTDSNEGYYLVCPDLVPGTDGITEDQCVKCLCYIIQHTNGVAPVPPKMEFEVIPVRWHHVGQPYPVIGIPAKGKPELLAPNISQFAMMLEHKVTEYIERCGLRELVELSKYEALTWDDVLRKHDA
jgi:hypothetical protein